MARVTAADRNAALATLNTALTSGWVIIYSGVRPTDADTALSGNTVLAELQFGATAFAAPAGGSMTANAITGDSSANAPGTATFARLFRTNKATAVMDISVATTGAELNLVTTTIAAGQPVNITSFVVSLGVGP